MFYGKVPVDLINAALQSFNDLNIRSVLVYFNAFIVLVKGGKLLLEHAALLVKYYQKARNLLACSRTLIMPCIFSSPLGLSLPGLWIFLAERNSLI